MGLALSKCYDPNDFRELAPELAVVDRVSPNENDLRRFEYAMALRAQADWMKASGRRPSRVYDVGGAGPFRHMVDAENTIHVIDPAELCCYTGKIWTEDLTLDRFIGESTCLAGNVFCLSVLEHVDDLDEFLYHLACLVAPGGLLFLTMDYQPHVGLKDERPFHWMRKRLFDPAGLAHVEEFLRARDFAYLGTVSGTWHTDYQTWGYAAASLALRKRA